MASADSARQRMVQRQLVGCGLRAPQVLPTAMREGMPETYPFGL